MLIAILFCSPRAFSAEVAFSLPLQGHYRPGKTMPVQVTATCDSSHDPLLLRATGAMSLQITPGDGGRIDAIVPWLSIRAIYDAKWATAAGEHRIELPLSALDSDERLIGYAGADPDALAPLFAGRKLVRVPLDAGDPLPGDISAWDALDGIVLDAAAAGKLNEGKLRALLANGTAIAIRAHKPPADGWPWRQQGAYWIVQIDIAGPTSAYAPAAYGPTQTWLRGWPASFRRAVILAAIVFTLLATAITLWRSRWMIAGATALCMLATALGFYWYLRQPPAIEARGFIIALLPGATQRDEWTYHAVLREADGEFDLQPLSRPVFGYRQQENDLNVSELCASDGRPLEIRYHLKPAQSFAFQTRSLSPHRENITTTLPADSMLSEMTDKLYVMKDDRIVGQTGKTEDHQWPGVVVERMPALNPVNPQ